MKSRQQYSAFYNNHILFKFDKEFRRSQYDRSPISWKESLRFDDLLQTQFSIDRKIESLGEFESNKFDTLNDDDKNLFLSMKKHIIDGIAQARKSSEPTNDTPLIANGNFSCLPPDMINCIASYLNLTDIAALRATRKQIKEIIDKLPLPITFYIPKAAPELALYVFGYKYPELITELSNVSNNKINSIIALTSDEKKLELTYITKPFPGLYQTDFVTIYGDISSWSLFVLLCFYSLVSYAAFIRTNSVLEGLIECLPYFMAIATPGAAPVGGHLVQMEIAARDTRKHVQGFFKHLPKKDEISQNESAKMQKKK